MSLQAHPLELAVALGLLGELALERDDHESEDPGADPAELSAMDRLFQEACAVLDED